MLPFCQRFARRVKGAGALRGGFASPSGFPQREG
jgi:hypothetical protein